MPLPPSKNESAGFDATDALLVAIAAIVLLGSLGAYINTVVGWYRDVLTWFYSKNWPDINKKLAIVFTLINIGLVAFIIFTIRRYQRVSRPPEVSPEKATVILPKEEVRASWNQIRELANSHNPSDWNMAVLRADALLDDVLRRLGYEGPTIADRLKIVDPTKFLSLDRVWAAHRLRNVIAHDPLEQHTRETIVHALRSFEQGFKELGMLEEKEKPHEAAVPRTGIS